MADETVALAEDSRTARRAACAAVEEFNADYCAVLDDGDLMDWPDFFTEDAFYNITSRENFDHGRPVGLVYCEGRGMLRDRALAIARTSMFGPRYLRHYLSNTRVTGIEPDGTVCATVNYMLIETLAELPEGRLHQAGRMIDRFRPQPDGGLLLSSRIAIYDTLLVPNALVLPV
ncbi:aromatic-ring-hydroxylating dioxygenase subunit beta [Mangrovicoccus ximenensis]|uniref:aromatic-ring-hydroxylating dioxygenase subunit beta n=1 Tax=Mangrovicoccus ximenensis TaxID=1911570 RepID=UPI000D391E04|nr:nuclear transport factor 2 family protein [Mangrovicoccus ximenensis]